MGRNMLPVLLLVFLLQNCGPTLAWENYKGYRLVEIQAEIPEQWSSLMEDINSMSKGNRSIAGLDVWEVKNKTAVVLVPPKMMESLPAIVSKSNMSYTILKKDVSVLLRDSKPTKNDIPMSWTAYHRYRTITNWMHLTADQYPNLVTVMDIGITYEGKPMKVMRIRSEEAAKNRRPAIFLDAGVHAREWIGPAVATYIMAQMTHHYSKHKAMVDSFEWYFLPVMNVDGYEHSHTQSRLWRKTRTNFMTKTSGCYGADPNRNFPLQWATGNEANTKPCDENYAGVKAGSEPSVQNFMKFVKGLKSDRVKLIGYFTLHSYGQMWMVPYGWTSEKPANYEDQMKVAQAGANAIEKFRGTKYTVGSPPSLLYSASGSTMDWMYSKAKVPFAFALELPPSGLGARGDGFLVSASKIQSIGEETFYGFRAATKAIKDKLSSKKVKHRSANGENKKKVTMRKKKPSKEHLPDEHESS